MATRSKTAQTAFDLAFPMIQKMGLELVDAEYKKEGQYYYLRLYIDKRGGVGIDECEKVSRAVDPVLEKRLGVTPDYFEVSSPGLDRPLKTPADYVRYEGQTIDMSLYQPLNDKKRHQAMIMRADDEGVLVKIDGQDIFLRYTDIAQAKRHIGI